MHSAQNDPSANDRRRTANLVYDDGNTAESVPANHVRDKTEQQYLKVANETLKVKRHCERCLNCLQAGCTECIVKTCAVCESARSLCATCRSAGHGGWQEEKRQCSRCFEKNLQCVRCKIYLIESDKEACNSRAAKFLTAAGGILHGITWWVFGVQHFLKSAAGPFFNWYVVPSVIACRVAKYPVDDARGDRCPRCSTRPGTLRSTTTLFASQTSMRYGLSRTVRCSRSSLKRCVVLAEGS